MLSRILHSELLLAEGRTDEAIKAYRETTLIGIKLGYSMELRLYNFPPLRDVVPRAFLKKGEPDSAVAEYEKLVDIDPASKDRRLINPVLHYRLAKLCQQTGKFEKAKAEYMKFLEIWKYADGDKSLLMDAKKRLANLKGKK